MKKFFNGTVTHKKSVIAVFMAAVAVCMVLGNFVAVNYDINDYLPENTHSTVSIEVMEEEFEGGIPNVRVMLSDVTIPEALEYKEKLAAVEGVTSVTWLDDAADITVPLSTLDTETVETYYKDSAALYSIAVEESSTISAVEAIRELIGDDNAMTGSAVSTAAATLNTVSEIRTIAIIAVIFVLIVLIFTTDSWLEPLIVLGGLGVAIVINNGTNLIFGEISFVTNAAGSILQLAVSLDYSVFLIHRFEECRKEDPDAESAMVDALCKSASSILSSGLTTVIGFLALVLMQFRIGPDLGLALAKGVAISLITVFVFMPALILCTYKWLDKTRHKSLMPSFTGFGKLVQRIAVPMVCIFAVVIVPAYLASNANSYYYGSSNIFGESTQLGSDTAKIEEKFGKNDTYVLLVPCGDTATETVLSNELHKLPQVTSGATALVSGSSELKNGMETLYQGTSELLAGIVEFYNATGSLSDGTGKLDDGVAELLAGIAQLYNGTSEMKNGTSKLRSETSGLDDGVSEKIDELMASVTGGDFELESFVSDKNTNIEAVQFVIKTKSIAKEEAAENVVEAEEQSGFWQKLLDLFGIN